MYANYDCDVSCTNIFEDLVNLLSKSAFLVNSPLSATHVLALEGLVAMINGISERIGGEVTVIEHTMSDHEPFWKVTCENYENPDHWVPYIQKKKHMKKKLMVGADHFNRDPKKGLQFLQGMHMLPDTLDPISVAYFLRLPGEAQKIQIFVEVFSERYYHQSPDILANKDAALLLSYSLILLNTDQHNAQVKRKMSEEDFIRNNRRINGGIDLPREYLSEIFHSICENEIKMTPARGAGISVRCYSNSQVGAVGLSQTRHKPGQSPVVPGIPGPNPVRPGSNPVRPEPNPDQTCLLFEHPENHG
nr:hypothetical protein [Tanacetum cinerariifolium]